MMSASPANIKAEKKTKAPLAVDLWNPFPEKSDCVVKIPFLDKKVVSKTKFCRWWDNLPKVNWFVAFWNGARQRRVAGYQIQRNNFKTHEKGVFCRFAVNAATEAAFAGKFQHLPKGDLAHHKINCMTMMFAAETNPGDNLDLYVWEDPMIQRRVFCQIEKADKLVYVTSIDFFGKQVVEPVVAAQDSKI